VKRALLLLVSLLVLAWPFDDARAHESLPIVIRVEQLAASDYLVHTRIPGNIPMDRRPRVTLDLPCPASEPGPGVLVYRCSSGAAAPAAVDLGWDNGATSAGILVRLTYADGETRNIVAAPGTQRVRLPQSAAGPRVLPTYFVIGVEHILFGIDHLLFLCCLVIVAGRVRRIVTTVTGFTLGHALTISLASLGPLDVNASAVEALIALSIVFLAAEIARGDRDSLIWRYPASVAALFGTLHGLGFASALSEVGLAHGEVALSLVGFNLGVETGQLAFVTGVLLVGRFYRKLAGQTAVRAAPRLPLGINYAIGVVAGFWFVERTVAGFLA
jgi:hydrogenase/urease accessory protein HupE